MTGKMWGLVAFGLVLAIIVVGGLLIPPAPKDASQGKPPDDTQQQAVDALIAKARKLPIGAPESEVVAKLGQPLTKSKPKDNLQTWGYNDLTVAIYKGKVCGIQGCGLIPRGELVPSELQVKEQNSAPQSNSCSSSP